MTGKDSEITEYNELDNTPIEELELSDNAIRVLKRFHVLSVGDCVFLIQEWETNMPSSLPHPELLLVLMTDVKQRLRDFGYWPTNDQGTGSVDH